MIQTLKIIVTVMAFACIAAGIAIFAGIFDAAALIRVPSTFNNPCAVTLIITGVSVLIVPFLPQYRK